MKSVCVSVFAVILSITNGVVFARSEGHPNDALSELMEQIAAMMRHERQVSDSAGLDLKGFHLGMPIQDAYKLAKKWLPDSLVVITTNNCIEIDVRTHTLDVGPFEATVQPMYFCQADKSGKVFRFNFDRKFLKKWFRYDVQTYEEWAYAFGREHGCDFRYARVEKRCDVGEALPFTVRQDTWRYRNGLKEFKITYFGEKTISDPTDGRDATAVDVGFEAATRGLFGGFPDNDLILAETMRLTGYRMGVRAWARYGYENADGARPGTLRLETMTDSDL